MKKLYFLTALMLLAFPSFSQKSKWYFIGITTQEDVGCLNHMNTGFRHVWVEEASLKQKLEELRASLKEEYGTNYSIVQYTCSPGSKLTIALVARKISCLCKNSSNRKMTENHVYVAGESESAIRKQLVHEMTYKFDLKGYTIKEVLTCESPLQKK